MCILLNNMYVPNSGPTHKFKGFLLISIVCIQNFTKLSYDYPLTRIQSTKSRLENH